MAKIVQLLKIRKNKLPATLRTNRDERYYAKVRKSGASRPLLEEERLKEWEYWALIHNEYPYTAAYKVHHMLIPKRKVSKDELTPDELEELNSILDQLGDVYDCYMTNFVRRQSIRGHYHIHLLTYKDARKEMKF